MITPRQVRRIMLAAAFKKGGLSAVAEFSEAVKQFSEPGMHPNFTGTKKDKLGHERHYVNGRQVKGKPHSALIKAHEAHVIAGIKEKQATDWAHNWSQQNPHDGSQVLVDDAKRSTALAKQNFEQLLAKHGPGKPVDGASASQMHPELAAAHDEHKKTGEALTKSINAGLVDNDAFIAHEAATQALKDAVQKHVPPKAGG